MSEYGNKPESSSVDIVALTEAAQEATLETGTAPAPVAATALPVTTTTTTDEEDADSSPMTTGGPSATQNNSNNKKKRLCRFPGCSRVIKSQGHCQRHGARAKRCRVDGCDKQAQGTHDGMCKRHWKAIHCPESTEAANNSGGNGKSSEAPVPPPPVGESVYDTILPQSIAFRPNQVGGARKQASVVVPPSQADAVAAFATASTDTNWDPPSAPEGIPVMPLVTFLRENKTGKPGWHRNEERRARGMFPVTTLSTQLEPWERQLALVEILLLSGGTPYANFKDLSHAWGREKGFHTVLTNAVCERRGEVERKRRTDAGKTFTAEERAAFREKLKRARSSNSDISTQQQQQLQPAKRQEMGRDDIMGGLKQGDEEEQDDVEGMQQQQEDAHIMMKTEDLEEEEEEDDHEMTAAAV